MTVLTVQTWWGMCFVWLVDVCVEGTFFFLFEMTNEHKRNAQKQIYVVREGDQLTNKPLKLIHFYHFWSAQGWFIFLFVYSLLEILWDTILL